MTSLRVFFIGGLISYRALFNWLNPWVFVPTLIVTPIFQVVFFAFLGRFAGLESDRFFVIGNAAFVSVIAFVGSSLMLHVHVPLRSFPSLALVVGVTAVACTGFGFLGGAIRLRVRDVIILINMLDAVLLIFCGVNIPTASLPHWMQVIGQGLPVTHGPQAARRVADGASLGSVSHFLLVELAIGLAYAAAGMALLRFLENDARRHASLETA